MFALQNIGQHDNALLITVGFSPISISIERVQNSFSQPEVGEERKPPMGQLLPFLSLCHNPERKT